MRNDLRARDRRKTARGPSSGFTLVELLVVILIVLLVSAVALPTVIPAVQNRQVSEGARILQAALAGARDAALRANAPRGIRLLPDATSSGGGVLSASRIIPIEQAPDLTDGRVTFPTPRANWLGNGINGQTANVPPNFPFPSQLFTPNDRYSLRGQYPYPLAPGVIPQPTRAVLMVTEVVWQNNDANSRLRENPTNWFWNVRIGDKIRFADSGRYYTIVGPMTVYNPEGFVNDGPPGTLSALDDGFIDSNGNIQLLSAYGFRPQYLFLVNGLDDNNDGYPDQGFDGLNQNLNFDTNGNPLNDDLDEWVPTNPPPPVGTGTRSAEIESWVGTQINQANQTNPLVPPPALTYAIVRRPVPSPGARELNLPSATVIDLTTWNSAFPERSRLPVNPDNTVDVLLSPAGQVIPTTEFSTPSSASMAYSFYHFWVADRSDLAAPGVYSPSPIAAGKYPQLPVPDGVIPGVATVLRRDRQLVTLFAKTGQVVTNSVENFYVDLNDPDNSDPNRPYRDAQLGIREVK